VILAQFKGTRWIAVMLSADGDPQQLKTKEVGQLPDHHVSKEPAGRRTKRS